MGAAVCAAEDARAEEESGRRPQDAGFGGAQSGIGNTQVQKTLISRFA
jgi:hypothetical protein